MSAEATTYSVLSAAAGVTGLVSTHIYPDQAAQDATMPFIVFERAGTEIVPTIHGTVALSRATMQVSCWAVTRSAAEAVAAAAQAAMVAARHLPANRDAFFSPETSAYAAVVDFTVTE